MKPSDTKAARPDPISMRLPEELKASLSEAAKASGRSLNAEIRTRLEWSLEQVPELASVVGFGDQLGSRIAALEAWARQQDPTFGAVTDDDERPATETLIANAKAMASKN